MSHPELVKWREALETYEESKDKLFSKVASPTFPQFTLTELLEMPLHWLEEYSELASGHCMISYGIRVQAAYIARAAIAREQDKVR